LPQRPRAIAQIDARRIWPVRATSPVAPYRAAKASPQAQFRGSLLGMAHSGGALPAPMPINAPAVMGNGD
jgi:hypothetical protein